jgi:hypothetical protein
LARAGMRSAAAPAGGCRTTTSRRWRRTLCGAVSPGPSRIAAEGGSNAGILIANMLTRYPDHFGALFCTIPLIDTRRYTKLLAGASWIAEYGDPDKPEDLGVPANLDAGHHMAAPGHRYPPMLLATTRRDDRVHPGHDARQAAGHGATKRTSMSPLPGGTVTERATRNRRLSQHSAIRFSVERSDGPSATLGEGFFLAATTLITPHCCRGGSRG